MSDDPEPREERLFTLTEAERTRREIEPQLIEAMDSRRKLAEADGQLAEIATRIIMAGGIIVNYERASRLRADHTRLSGSLRDSLETIEATGCVVKDLDIGLLDFPARMNGQIVYLCWRLGEDRIRFWHNQDEGFGGRKPIDPRDTGPSGKIQ
jgi:hypothetical protein